MSSLPFKASAYDGWADVEGLVSVEKDSLVLELETKDGLFGVLRSGVKEVRLAFSDLAEAMERPTALAPEEVSIPQRPVRETVEDDPA